MSGPIETEIKLRIPGALPDAVLKALRLVQDCGFQIRSPRAFQADQLFDRPDGEIRRAGQLLRVRVENGRATLTYKGPALPGRHKRREELEASTTEGTELIRILDRLGYVPSFRYEKYRTTFAAGSQKDSGLITVDETPIGVFLELEGAEDWIDATARRLGFAPTDYVTASYATLYGEYVALHGGPSDMTFKSGVYP